MITFRWIKELEDLFFMESILGSIELNKEIAAAQRRLRATKWKLREE